MTDVRGTTAALVAAVDAALPQTQCTRCGYPDCRGYAEAIVRDAAPIDRCPPGGAEGIDRLAALTGRAPSPLDPACGREQPLRLARIDEAACIGCRLCLKACPVDAILGGPKSMHVVIGSDCTGCELCLPVCPVDCIALDPPADDATGWRAWSGERAARARVRHRAHRERTATSGAARRSVAAEAPVPRTDTAPAALPPERDRAAARALVEAALARARAGRAA